MSNINKEAEDKICLRMYNTGDYIVKGTGNYFWANSNHKGCLIEACTTKEIYLVQKMFRERRQGIKHEVKTYKL